ncbi:MAG: four helix bundle protein [Bacteroidales bacterium]|nr:four helix bundle protein [Bacteroidales bacterium]
MNRIDLENRLINLAVDIDELTERCYPLRTRPHLIDQIRRASTSSALNYAEAQSSATDRDFIHKLSLVLKELRETHVCLRIIERITKDSDSTKQVLNETDEMIRIFHASRDTVVNRIRNQAQKKD